MSGVTSIETLRSEGALAGLAAPLGETAVRLRGHASTRRFFRVRPAAGTTAVLVVYPAEAADGPARYVTTAGWFAAAGVRVPRIIAAGERALVVEDGGDRLLDAVDSEPQRSRSYRQAVDVIARLQAHGRRAAPANPGWALNAERLRRELEFAEEHALRAWLGANTAAAGARASAYDRLAGLVAGVPAAACHRDFHARNLLAPAGRLIVLDFQDVMSGPFLYDLASLLWDNYRDLPEVLRRELAADFWAQCGRELPVSSEAAVPRLPAGLPPAGRQAYCLVGLQRSLKALGTFGYQVSRAGNPDYARYAPRTWRHARTALAQLGWHDMLACLSPYEALLSPPA